VNVELFSWLEIPFPLLLRHIYFSQILRCRNFTLYLGVIVLTVGKTRKVSKVNRFRSDKSIKILTDFEYA